ncbi:MAG: lipopolysaccharide heptosyltransferase II [Desulfobacterales bacterium]
MLNILVRAPNWLGDGVMSLPFFDRLHSRFPDLEVDLIARNSVADLFLHHPGIATTHSFAQSELQGLAKRVRFGRRIGRIKSYQGFITLAPSFSSALVGVAACRGWRMGYSGEGRELLFTRRLPPPAGLHRVVSYCRLLDLLPRFLSTDAVAGKEDGNTPVPQVKFPFSADEQDRTFLDKVPGRVDIVFNVNSQAPSRRLPLKTWIELGNRLLEDSRSRRRILFVGTSAEQPRVARVMAGINKQHALVDFSGQTTLRELALLLRDADLVISNDSGPMHLANAVGTPLITFFGAGDPAETSPFNASETVVIQKPLPCSPCLKNRCRYPRLHCLERITGDEIYRAAIELENRRV